MLIKCANQKSLGTNYYGYTESSYKSSFARYNGTNSVTTAYGNEVYKYYVLFNKYK